MSGLPWFRMYVDFLNDPKMISIAFEDQRHFIGVLALMCDGVLDQECDPVIMDRIVSQRLWLDYSTISEVKRRLVNAELIDEMWLPLSWSKRQFKSDHDATGAARQKRYREKQKVDKQRKKKSDALCNATVTLPDTDTDTDTDLKRLGHRDDRLSFEGWWNWWPKKVAKKDAFKAWKTLTQTNRKKALHDSATRYASTEKHFIPNPATYLRGERWNDELVKPPDKPLNSDQIMHNNIREAHGFNHSTKNDRPALCRDADGLGPQVQGERGASANMEKALDSEPWKH